jgi:hypothetical membrane protein
MSSKEDLTNLIRKTQTIVSILLFFIISLFCWKTTGLEVKEIQISHWGAKDMTYSWLWNGVIILLSISILFNNILFIKQHHRLKNKTIPYILFSFVGLNLFLVGVFNIEYGILHDLPAWVYFFSYPLSVFIMAYLNRGSLLYREWFIHLIFSIVMIVLPISVMSLFEGLAIPEIVHSSIVSLWNIHTAFKRFDII